MTVRGRCGDNTLNEVPSVIYISTPFHYQHALLLLLHKTKNRLNPRLNMNLTPNLLSTYFFLKCFCWGGLESMYQ
jgi:hypothetical protein